MLYDVPSPTEALLITGGFRSGDPGNPYRIVVGGGAWSIPILHKVSRFDIGANNITVKVSAPSSQNVVVDVEATVVFRVQPDKEHITKAASRFQDKDEAEILQAARDVFSGETRAMIGQMTVEEMISDRIKLTQNIWENADLRMSQLGWQIDNFQIRDISDSDGYIASLSAKEKARVHKIAEVAEAEAEAEIEKSRQAAERQKSEYRRDTEIKVSENIKLTAAAKAEADASGPLSKAEAERKVVEKLTELANDKAALKEQELLSEVIKPAEANAKKREIEAEAEAKATRIISEAIVENNGAILDKQIIDQMPEIVNYWAEALKDSNMTIVGDGGNQVVQTLTQLLGATPALRELAKVKDKPKE